MPKGKPRRKTAVMTLRIEPQVKAVAELFEVEFLERIRSNFLISSSVISRLLQWRMKTKRSTWGFP